MHLQNHFGLQLFLAESAIDGDHGHLDDVGRGALDGGIHGIAFGIAADGGIARIDVGQVATALKFCEDVTPFFGAIDARVHVFLDLRVGFEIAVYQLFGFPAGDAESFRETEGRDAVDDAEIGRFGLAALVARDLFDGFVEDARSGGGVDVVAGVEVGDHVLVAAEVGHDAQLNLRIVGTEKRTTVVGHKCLADFATVLPANGDVLQVGIRR